MGVPKLPAKIFHFEEILKGTFQLSVEHLIFHLELMSVCVAALKPCSSTVVSLYTTVSKLNVASLTGVQQQQHLI